MTKIRSVKELEFFISYVPDAIVQELVTGEEYTLDILADLNGRVRCVVPRLRMRPDPESQQRNDSKKQ